VGSLDEFLNLLGEWLSCLRGAQDEGILTSTDNPIWYVKKAMAVLTWWNEWQYTVSTTNPDHKNQFEQLINWASKPPMVVPKMVIGSLEQLSSVLRSSPPSVEGKVGERAWRWHGVDVEGLHGGVPIDVMARMWKGQDGDLFEVEGTNPQKVAEKINQNLRKIARKTGRPLGFRAAFLRKDQVDGWRAGRSLPFIRRVVNPLPKGDAGVES